MTYETMNWEAESARVVAAFEIIVPCEFRTIKEGKDAGLFTTDTGKLRVPFHQGTITIYYTRERRFYEINLSRNDMTAIAIDWQRKMVNFQLNDAHVAKLAKGLFNLNLLTAGVESALKVTISSHQKLEWTLEYERRMKASQS